MRIIPNIIFFLTLTTLTQSQCCLQFEGRKCVSCPNGTHLFRGNCIFDTPYCSVYKDGFDCSKCNEGYQINDQNQCTKIQIIQQPQEITNVYTFSDGVNNLSGISADIYNIVDDFQRGTRMQITNGKTLGTKIIMYKNNTASATIQYQNNEGNYFKAVLEVDTNSFIMKQISFEQVTNLSISQKPINQPNKISMESQSNNKVINSTNVQNKQIINNSSIPSSISLQYSNFNPLAPLDQYYVICKDLLASQNPQNYKIDPISTKKYMEGDNIKYLLRYSKPDNSIIDVYITFDKIAYTANVQKQVQITSSAQTITTPKFTKIDNKLIYKDINFIIVSQYINQQSYNKYKEAPIDSVQKMDIGNNSIFKINFIINNFVWEVSATINTKNFTLSGFTQIQKQAIDQSAQLKYKNNSVSISVTSNTTLEPQNNISSMNNKNMSQQKNSNANQHSLTPSISGKQNSNKTEKTVPNNATIQNSSNSSPIVSNKSLTQNSSNEANNPITIQNNSISNDFKKTMYLRIQQLSVGFSALNPSDMQTSQFRQIDSLIRASNTVQLKNTYILGAFVKMTSFTKNYQIYYTKTSSQDTFAAVISRDQLRKRTYIISFNKVGYI